MNKVFYLEVLTLFLKAGLLTQPEWQQAISDDRIERELARCRHLRDVLAWLLVRQIVEVSALKTRHADWMRELGPAASAERRKLVQQAIAGCGAMRRHLDSLERQGSEKSSQPSSELFPATVAQSMLVDASVQDDGMQWRWVGRFGALLNWVIVLVGFGGALHFFSKDDPLPMCSDDEFRKALYSLQMAEVPYQKIRYSLYPENYNARISDVSELAEVPQESMRVCRYTLSYNGKMKEQAAVIYRAPEKTEGMLVGVEKDKGVELPSGHARARLANFEIMQARLAHLTPEGKFAQTGQPVGRAAMIQAMRENLPSLRLPYWMRVNQERLQYTNGIRDIEPTGVCMPQEGDEQYACPVLIEVYGVSAGVSLAPQRVIAPASFNFKRLPEGRWTVADDFGETYLKFLRQLQSDL